jgi:hypothetical protein
LLTDVATDSNYKGGFNTYTASMNPGLQRVFPWLSNIARNFQEYRFNMIKVFYISDCPTSYAGSIMLTAAYDPSIPNPNNESDMGSYEGVVIDNIWKSVSFQLDKKGFNSQLHYYVRGTNPNTIIENEDIKLLDCANLIIAFDNVSNGTTSASLTCGKIWIEYDISLLRPFSNAGLQQQITTNSWICEASVTVKTTPLGASRSAIISNTVGKFISGGWDAYVGTNTWLALQGVGSKVFKISITGTVVTSIGTLTCWSYNPTSYDDGNKGFVTNITDTQELMQLADTTGPGNLAANGWTQNTTGNFDFFSSTLLINGGTATIASITYVFQILPNSVFYFNTTGGCSTLATAAILVSDADSGMPSIATSMAAMYG